VVLLNDDTIDEIRSFVKKDRNIILTGGHGVGKTTMMMDLLNEIGKTPIKYYSCATLDPWVDLVGIPIPDNDNFYPPQMKKAINKQIKETSTLKFCRPKDLIEAKVMVCDEINRSHPKVQNSLLEAIQFKTINGQPLPNLVMVIAMQNPATKLYQVTELDPALVDRFHARITLTGCPSVEFYKTKGMDGAVAKSLVDWWNDDLNDETRQMVTPRTLEYIGCLIRDKLNWKFGLGDSLGIPLFGLESRLANNCGISKYEGLTLRKICRPETLEDYTEKARNDRDFATYLVKEIEHSRAIMCWDAAEVIDAMPEEFQMRLMMNEKWSNKMKAEFDGLDESFHESAAVMRLKHKLDQVSGMITEE